LAESLNVTIISPFTHATVGTVDAP
jgi:hypothetical protein